MYTHRNQKKNKCAGTWDVYIDRDCKLFSSIFVSSTVFRFCASSFRFFFSFTMLLSSDFILYNNRMRMIPKLNTAEKEVEGIKKQTKWNKYKIAWTHKISSYPNTQHESWKKRRNGWRYRTNERAKKLKWKTKESSESVTSDISRLNMASNKSDVLILNPLNLST